MARSVTSAILMVVLLSAAGSGGDWPRFQGPTGSGVAPEKGLLRKWPEGGPQVLWTRKLGMGYAGAAIRAGRVYVLDRVGENGEEEEEAETGRRSQPTTRSAPAQDVLRCIDLNSGQELWTFAYNAPGSRTYPGSRNVPTVESDRIYVQSPGGLLQCLDPETRRVVWSRHMVRDYVDPKLQWREQVRLPQWGFTQHPVVLDDRLIVAPFSPSAGVVALDRRTGKELWRSGDIGTNLFSHVTPYVTELCGVKQVVTIGNKHRFGRPPAVISGVDLDDGRILWQLDTWHRYNVPIPQPVRIAGDRLFVTGGYTIGCFVLKVARAATAGERWSVEYVFKDNWSVTSHIQNPLFHEGHLFAQSYDKFHQETHNGLTCIDLEGNIKWKTGPRMLFGSGNFIIADGLIFVMCDPTGELVLAEANPVAYRELARAKVLSARGRNVWAPMALADGKLVVRDLFEMKCLAVK